MGRLGRKFFRGGKDPGVVVVAGGLVAVSGVDCLLGLGGCIGIESGDALKRSNLQVRHPLLPGAYGKK